MHRLVLRVLAANVIVQAGDILVVRELANGNNALIFLLFSGNRDR